MATPLRGAQRDRSRQAWRSWYVLRRVAEPLDSAFAVRQVHFAAWRLGGCIVSSFPTAARLCSRADLTIAWTIRGNSDHANYNPKERRIDYLESRSFFHSQLSRTVRYCRPRKR